MNWFKALYSTTQAIQSTASESPMYVPPNSLPMTQLVTANNAIGYVGNTLSLDFANGYQGQQLPNGLMAGSITTKTINLVVNNNLQVFKGQFISVVKGSANGDKTGNILVEFIDGKRLIFSGLRNYRQVGDWLTQVMNNT